MFYCFAGKNNHIPPFSLVYLLLVAMFVVACSYVKDKNKAPLCVMKEYNF